MTKLIALLTWLVTLLVPVVLVLSAVRLLLTPWFLELEYRMPGFPQDSYGFTQAERLHWARYAVEYLINDAGIDYLESLRFPEGQQAPPESCYQMRDCARLYNDRELKHMLDVKIVTQNVLWVWRYAWVALFVLGVIFWANRQMNALRLALGRGGWLTALIACSVVVFVLLAFGVVFVAFHDMFFARGTWVFLYSDTLIRLFPERFWRDVFLFGLGAPAFFGALLGWQLMRRR